MIEAGLLLPLRGMWRGGANYYHNLLGCYQRYPDPDVRLEVFTDSPAEVETYRGDAIGVRHCPEVKNLSRRRPGDWPRILQRQALGHDPAVLRAVERSGVDLLTHNSAGGQNAVKTLFWMPDLQHKFFPAHFARREHAKRDKELADTLRWGHVLLSSQTSVGHLRRFYPALDSVEAHVLRFPNTTAVGTAILSRDELNAAYPARRPYFFLPNQFWMHKNHRVVVAALRQAAPEVRVLCTGPMEDPRDRSYVPALLAEAKAAGLEDRFVCLGMVPYHDLVSLMHHSVAVLQPSRFEGWSTSVEEAKAMCKRIVLSDIDVHREQAPPRGTFFPPDDPAALASALSQALAEHDPDTEAAFAARRDDGKSRIEQEWIAQFTSVLKSTIDPAIQVVIRTGSNASAM